MGLLTKSMVRYQYLKEEEFYTPILSFEIFSKVKTLCARSYRNENHYKDTFSKSLSKTHSTNTSLGYYPNNTLYAFL